MPNISDYALRLMDCDDKEHILAWRNTDRVRMNMYTDHIISRDEHEAWFSKALVDESARYLIFEINHRPVGFVSFTNISKVHNRCVWAFYLGEADLPRGTGSSMEYFALQYAFEELKIRKLCCEVFLFNAGVIKMHEKFGFSKEGHYVAHYLKKDAYEDIAYLAMFNDSWVNAKETLKTRCFGKNV